MAGFKDNLIRWSVPSFLETSVKAIIMAVAALLFSKEDFGILTATMLIFTFHPLLQLGITDGLIIKMPGWYAKNMEHKINHNLSISVTFVVSIILLIFVIAFIGVNFYETLSKVSFISFIYLLLLIPYQIFNHYLLLNRYTYNFKITFNARILNISLRLMIQLPFLFIFGIYGFVIGEFLVYFLSSIYMYSVSKDKLKIKIKKSSLIKLLKFGFPIFIISFVGTISTSLDKTIAAYLFDFEEVAAIGLLAFIASLWVIVSGQVLSIFSQYVREFYVLLNEKENTLNAYLIFIHISSFVFFLFGSIFFLALSDFIFPAYLVKYYEYVSILSTLFLITYLKIVWSILMNYMIVIGERRSVIFLQLLFCICMILGSIFSIYNEESFGAKDLIFILINSLGFQVAATLLVIVKIIRSRKFLLYICFLLGMYVIPIFIGIYVFLFSYEEILIYLLLILFIYYFLHKKAVINNEIEIFNSVIYKSYKD